MDITNCYYFSSFQMTERKKKKKRKIKKDKREITVKARQQFAIMIMCLAFGSVAKQMHDCSWAKHWSRIILLSTNNNNNFFYDN